MNLRKKKKIPKLQEGGIVTKSTLIYLPEPPETILTPEQLEKFTKEVEKVLLKDLYKRLGLSAKSKN